MDGNGAVAGGGLGVITLPPSSMLVGGGYEIPPMPTDEAELNAKFEEIVEELDLTDAKKAVGFFISVGVRLSATSFILFPPKS